MNPHLRQEDGRLDPCGPCRPGSRMEPRTLAAKWGGKRRVGRQEAAKCSTAAGGRRMLRGPRREALHPFAPCTGARAAWSEGLGSVPGREKEKQGVEGVVVGRFLSKGSEPAWTSFSPVPTRP